MKDDIIADKKWEFDGAVTDCFEDMLTRSIPQYNVMRKAILDLASIKIDKMVSHCSYRETPNSTRLFSLLDIGCSDGLQIADFLHKYDCGSYKCL